MKLDCYSTPEKPEKMKDYVIPRDMVVIIDTREQAPLFISRVPKGLTITRDNLKDGDYSIRGFENRIMFERKGISDLTSYIGKDHVKTQEKLRRCKGFDFIALVIEAEERDLLAPKMYAKASIELYRQAICAMEIRYGLHVYYSRSRKDIERWMLDRMIKYWSVKRETI
jgi:ERCC4-type nuclease